MIGTMMIPPICWATRGSETRELTMTPATTDDRPTAGPRTKTPISHDAIRDDAEQCRAVHDRRQGDEHEVRQPARQDARHERGDDLAREQLHRPDRGGQDGLQASRLLLADDAERRDGERDVGRHQQEEHEELLDREGAGQLARGERRPLRSLGEDLRGQLLRQGPLADDAGEGERGDGQDHGRERGSSR